MSEEGTIRTKIELEIDEFKARLKEAESKAEDLGNKVTAENTKIMGSTEKVGYTYTEMTRGITRAANAGMGLWIAYDRINNAQVATTRQTLMLSRAQESADRAQQRLSDTIAQYGSTSEEAQQATLDYEQAIMAVDLRTQSLANTQGDLNRGLIQTGIYVGTAIPSMIDFAMALKTANISASSLSASLSGVAGSLGLIAGAAGVAAASFAGLYAWSKYNWEHAEEWGIQGPSKQIPFYGGPASAGSTQTPQTPASTGFGVQINPNAYIPSYNYGGTIYSSNSSSNIWTQNWPQYAQSTTSGGGSFYNTPGWSEGGVVGLHGPEWALLGEYGPEYVLPARKGQKLGLSFYGGGTGGGYGGGATSYGGGGTTGAYGGYGSSAYGNFPSYFSGYYANLTTSFGFNSTTWANQVNQGPWYTWPMGQGVNIPSYFGISPYEPYLSGGPAPNINYGGLNTFIPGLPETVLNRAYGQLSQPLSWGELQGKLGPNYNLGPGRDPTASFPNYNYGGNYSWPTLAGANQGFYGNTYGNIVGPFGNRGFWTGGSAFSTIALTPEERAIQTAQQMARFQPSGGEDFYRLAEFQSRLQNQIRGISQGQMSVSVHIDKPQISPETMRRFKRDFAYGLTRTICDAVNELRTV